MLRPFHLKHDEGGTVDLIQILIGILALAFLLYLNISITKTIGMRNKIELIAHEYILRMETDGYLTMDAKKELQDTLLAIGMISPDISGSISGPVIYGKKISLTIKGNLPTTSFNMISDRFSLNKDNDAQIGVNITKTSNSRSVK